MSEMSHLKSCGCGLCVCTLAGRRFRSLTAFACGRMRRARKIKGKGGRRPERIRPRHHPPRRPPFPLNPVRRRAPFRLAGRYIRENSPIRAESSVAGYGGVAVTRRLSRVAMFAARGKFPGEGIGWFAAKRGEGSDGRARGIEAEMILAFPIVKYCLTTGCRGE